MTFFALTPLVLLILIFIIGATVGVATRRARVARPDHHHWIVRILCAVLVVAALVAVGVGTWRGTGASLTLQPIFVTQPTTAPLPLPKAAPPNPKLDLGPTKLIGTVLLVRKLQDQFVPICGESLTLDWPPQAGDELVFQGESAGATYKVRMNLREFVSFSNGEIRAMRGASVERRGTSWSSSGGVELKLDTLVAEDFGGHGEMLYHAPLSLIPSVAGQNLRLLVHLTRANRDDPLQQIAASEWLSGDAKNMRLDDRNSHVSSTVRYDPSTPPGIRMLTFLGPSVILLLLAAIAGSAVFPRGCRAYAFTGLLTGMVLYAGTLDAVVLQRRAHAAADTKQPESVRAATLQSMSRGTFFHAGSAAKRIRQIAADPANSAFIRSLAENMTESARQRKP